MGRLDGCDHRFAREHGLGGFGGDGEGEGFIAAGEDCCEASVEEGEGEEEGFEEGVEAGGAGEETRGVREEEVGSIG